MRKENPSVDAHVGVRSSGFLFVDPLESFFGSHSSWCRRESMRAIAKAKWSKLADVSETPPMLAQAREQFLGMVEGLRPELHRYAARLTGSVIEGEDIVQDVLAQAFYALILASKLPPL